MSGWGWWNATPSVLCDSESWALNAIKRRMEVFDIKWTRTRGKNVVTVNIEGALDKIISTTFRTWRAWKSEIMQTKCELRKKGKRPKRKWNGGVKKRNKMVSFTDLKNLNIYEKFIINCSWNLYFYTLQVELEVLPSQNAERIEPRIDAELKRKAEKAAALKEKGT